MTIPNNPIVNAGLLYVNGLQISNATSSKTLFLDQGAARDSSNINDIILSSTIILNGASTGPNGVDGSTLIASRFYAVYVIGDSTDNKSTAGLFSLSPNAPALPSGYDTFRRVGWILTDSFANIFAFSQTGVNESRNYYYVNTINVLTNSTPTNYLSVGLTSAVPPITQSNSNEVLLRITYTPSFSNNTVQFTPLDSAATGSIQFGCGIPGIQVGMLNVPTLHVPFQRINVKVSPGDTLTLDVAGYTDYI